MPRPLDAFDYPLPRQNERAPVATLARDEFGGTPSRPGFDPNSTGRNLLDTARALAGAQAAADTPGTGVQNFGFQFNVPDPNLNPAILRRDLRLDELVSHAAIRKAELNREPIKDAFAQAQLEHEQAATAAIGATNLRQIKKDAEAMRHVAGFENYMLNAPEEGTPEYDQYVRSGIARFPAIVTTAHYASHLPKLGQAHDMAALAKQLPEGSEITGGEIGGGKQSHLTFKRTPPQAVEVGDYNADKKVFTRNNKGKDVSIRDAKGKVTIMKTDEYEQLGGQYSPETAAERAGTTAKKAGVKHLGTYNPETGNFE